eukprot:scaffold32350_cov60-Phaeocystis_antarctica.AAC.2
MHVGLPERLVQVELDQRDQISTCAEHRVQQLRSANVPHKVALVARLDLPLLLVAQQASHEVWPADVDQLALLVSLVELGHDRLSAQVRHCACRQPVQEPRLTIITKVRCQDIVLRHGEYDALRRPQCLLLRQQLADPLLQLVNSLPQAFVIPPPQHDVAT